MMKNTSNRRMNKRSAIMLISSFMAFAAIAIIVLEDQKKAGMNTDDPEKLRLGRQIYANFCAECHGTRMEGEPNWKTPLESGALPAPPHDATGHTWHHSEGHLFKVTKFGVAPFAPEGWVSNMPAFQGRLSDNEIWAVLSYIKSKWPPKEVAHHERVTTQEKK